MIINIVLIVVIYWNIYTCFSRYIDYKNTDKNFDLNVGANYARIKAEDKIWEGLGFVLQWAKYGLKK